MYGGGSVVDDSALGDSLDNEDCQSSSSSMSENELENYLYSQIHYQTGDETGEIPDIEARSIDNLQQKEKDTVVLSDSDQTDSTPRLSSSVKSKRFIEKDSSSNSSSDSDSDFGEASRSISTNMQFNAGANLILSHKGSFHPLMSVRQQYRQPFHSKPRYFEQGNGQRKFGSVTSLVASFSESKNAEFHCYLCGETNHLSKACHLRPNERRRFNYSYSSNTEDEVCSTCGRKDHHPRSWLIRGPPRLVCPNLRCSSCGDPGHKLVECSDYTSVRGRVCLRCGIPGHLQSGCPDLWRMFHATIQSTDEAVSTKSLVTINERRFCYVCGRKGHFGFECTWELRPPTARFLKSPFISTYSANHIEEVAVELDSAEEGQEGLDSIVIGDSEEETYCEQDYDKPWQSNHDFRAKKPKMVGSHNVPTFRHRKEPRNMHGSRDFGHMHTRGERKRQENWRKRNEMDDDYNRYNSNYGKGKNNRRQNNHGPKSPKTRERWRRKITFA